MNARTASSTRHSRSGLITLLGALVALGSLVGCTSQEEKAQKAIQEAVLECRTANVDGAFYEARMGAETDEVLQLTCEEEIEDFEMTSEVSAEASTGPVRWSARIDKETGVWKLYSASWKNLDRARSALDDDEEDLSEESYTYAEAHFAKAQEEVPESEWIRVRRMENLLDLRAETREKRADDGYEIGEKASAHLEETIDWAEQHDDADTMASAQVLVVDYVKDYLDYADRILSSEASSDEWLEKAAEEAEKEGDHEAAQEYLDEIEEANKRRAEKKEIYGKLAERAEAYLCEQIDEISLADVESKAIQDDVTQLRNAIDCTEVKPLAEIEKEHAEAEKEHASAEQDE